MTIETGRIRTIPYRPKGSKCVAFNGDDFIFLQCCKCDLVSRNECGSEECCGPLRTICLTRDYNCLCYDKAERCYWAVAGLTLYRLDCCFQETGQFPICGTYQQRANGISCGCRGNEIWLAYASQVVSMEPGCCKGTCFLNQDKCRINTGVLALCCCRVVSFIRNGRQYVEAICGNGCGRVEFCIPTKYRLVGILPCCPCDGQTMEEGCAFCLLLSERCSCRLLLADCLVVTDCGRENWCCDTVCCDPFCCDADCHEKCDHESCCCGKCEIMHSIALEEAGIAHILNAEGEKLQKAVATTSNIDELLCVNESVKRTITQITLLEGLLYSKLEALQDDCGGYRKCNCRPPEPPCSFEQPVTVQDIAQ